MQNIKSKIWNQIYVKIKSHIFHESKDKYSYYVEETIIDIASPLPDDFNKANIKYLNYF